MTSAHHTPPYAPRDAEHLVTIYGLTDPRTGDYRYVGKTIQLLSWRRQQHVMEARQGVKRDGRARWIRSLLAEGVEPRALVIECVPMEEWKDAEQFWIDLLRFYGVPLTNERAAGAGGCGPRRFKWTTELRAMLGVVGDDILAAEIGITRKAVSYWRRRFGIAASYDQTRMKPPPDMGGWNRKTLPPEIIARLGTIPDYVLATDALVTKHTIQRERNRRGIPSYADRTGNNGRHKYGEEPPWLKSN